MWAHLADRPSSLLRTVPHATPPHRHPGWSSGTESKLKLKWFWGRQGSNWWPKLLARSKRTFAAKDRIGDKNELLPPTAKWSKGRIAGDEISPPRMGWLAIKINFWPPRIAGSFCWRSDRYEHFPPRFELLEIKMNFCRHGFAKGQGPRAKDRIVGDQNEFLTP